MLSFNPGPSKLFGTVVDHLHEGLREQISSISHRSHQFRNLIAYTVSQLKEVLGVPSDYHVFFLGSATEAMERVIQNLVERHSYHLINGAFSQRFFDVSRELGKEPQCKRVVDGLGHDFETVEIPEGTELVCVTHCETSTGVMQPMGEIVRLRERYPDVLLALDAVSSVPFAPIDFSVVDALFFSVQKGFGLPAGLGVVIVSPRALDKARALDHKGVSIGSYHNFLHLEKQALHHQTPETPNVMAIYLLGKVCGDFLAEGLTVLRELTLEKERLLLQSSWPPFVRESRWRSPTVMVLDVGVHAPLLRENLLREGIVVGKGYGPHSDLHLRVGNFFAHDLVDMERLVDSLKR